MLKRRAAPMIAGATGEAIRVGTRLGWLYLDQGHLADAGAVFEAVLRSDPDDASAGEGLALARRRLREAAAAQGAAPLPRRSLEERRIAVLTEYLERLRRAAAATG
jgi:hypothetical protein